MRPARGQGGPVAVVQRAATATATATTVGPVAAPVRLLVGRRVRPVAGVHRHGLDGRPEADHRQGAHVASRTAQLGRPANVICFFKLYSRPPPPPRPVYGHVWPARTNSECWGGGGQVRLG